MLLQQKVLGRKVQEISKLSSHEKNNFQNLLGMITVPSSIIYSLYELLKKIIIQIIKIALIEKKLILKKENVLLFW